MKALQKLLIVTALLGFFAGSALAQWRAAVIAEASRVVALLKAAGIKARLDDREQLKPGAKFFEWEKKGVPLRLELGPRDLASESVMIKARHDRAKTVVSFAEVVDVDSLHRLDRIGDVPVHARCVAVEHLQAVHTAIASSGFEAFGKDEGQGDEGSGILRPALKDRNPRQIHLFSGQ